MQAKTISLVIPPIIATLVWVTLTIADAFVVGALVAFFILVTGYALAAWRLREERRWTDHQRDAERVAATTARSRRVAIMDPANGLLATWYFELRLEEEIARCRRYGEQAAVVVLRHESPDSLPPLVIQEAAGHALRGVRENDLTGNLEDGIGFCLLQCDGELAAQVTERLLNRLGPGWQAAIAVVPDTATSGKLALALARDHLTRRPKAA